MGPWGSDRGVGRGSTTPGRHPSPRPAFRWGTDAWWFLRSLCARRCRLSTGPIVSTLLVHNRGYAFDQGADRRLIAAARSFTCQFNWAGGRKRRAGTSVGPQHLAGSVDKRSGPGSPGPRWARQAAVRGVETVRGGAGGPPRTGEPPGRWTAVPIRRRSTPLPSGIPWNLMLASIVSPRCSTWNGRSASSRGS